MYNLTRQKEDSKLFDNISVYIAKEKPNKINITVYKDYVEITDELDVKKLKSIIGSLRNKSRIPLSCIGKDPYVSRAYQRLFREPHFAPTDIKKLICNGIIVYEKERGDN